MASLSTASATLSRLVRPIYGENELDQLLDLVGQARIVVLGAGSYGTHEHYDVRASLTRKLINQRGFAGVVIEADWPDALRVDRYVRELGDDDDAASALALFHHFPAWAWRNDDVERFVEWLRYHNYCLRERVGFYGIDLYGLNATLRALRTHGDVAPDDLVAELVDMQWRHAARSGRTPSGEAWLHALQRAPFEHVDGYYRAILGGGTAAWNLRSVHMADTIDMLAKQLGSEDGPAKLVVWVHDMHAGDARASAVDRVSLGQQLRTRHDDQVALVGFTTYEGKVRCAPDWDAPSSEIDLPPAIDGSWEALFHETGVPRFMISASALRRAIGEHVQRKHRSVGAVMRSNPYCEVRLADHYDLIVHVDTTRAVAPMCDPVPDATSTEFAGIPSRE
jgi:erythromycin esterase-like protein